MVTGDTSNPATLRNPLLVFVKEDVCVTIKGKLTPAPSPCSCLDFLKTQDVGVSQEMK